MSEDQAITEETEAEKTLPRSHYDITTSFLCPYEDCQKINSIMDPRLLAVAVQGLTIRATCQHCKNDAIFEPRAKPSPILAPNAGPNRHQRRAAAAERRTKSGIIVPR